MKLSWYTNATIHQDINSSTMENKDLRMIHDLYTMYVHNILVKHISVGRQSQN